MYFKRCCLRPSMALSPNYVSSFNGQSARARLTNHSKLSQPTLPLMILTSSDHKLQQIRNQPPAMRPALLLLPPSEHPLDAAATTKQYKPFITSAIIELTRARLQYSRGATLVIAVLHSILTGPDAVHKQLSWNQCQALLATIYSVAGMVCEMQQIPSEVDGGPGSVDVRVVLVDNTPAQAAAQVVNYAPNNTTIPDLATFAATHHPWSAFLRAEGVATQAWRQLTSMWNASGDNAAASIWLSDLPASAVPGSLPDPATTTLKEQQPTRLHSVVCLGGTFDYLHPGHKLLLTAAAYLLDVPKHGSGKHCRLVIGITGQGLMANKKYVEQTQSWPERASHVLKFLTMVVGLTPQGFEKEQKPTIKFNSAHVHLRGGAILIECVEINDMYGPAAVDEEITALVVSGETMAGGEMVNKKRIENGLKPSELFSVNVLDRTESGSNPGKFANKISSTEIRRRRAEAAKRKGPKMSL